MANLLPKQYIETVKKEHRVRTTITVFVALIATTILGSVFLTPTLILSQSKANDAEKSVEITKQFVAQQEKGGVLSDIRQTRNQIERLDKIFTDATVSEVISVVQNSVPLGIRLDFINYKRVSGDADILRLSGMASTRKELLSFTRQLDREELLGDVDLPISNLAKSINIGFTLELKVFGSDVPEPVSEMI